jgi:hypothetical protein
MESSRWENWNHFFCRNFGIDRTMFHKVVGKQGHDYISNHKGLLKTVVYGGGEGIKRVHCYKNTIFRYAKQKSRKIWINKNNNIKQYIYNTHPSNLPMGANKPQRFTNAYNEHIIY